MQFHYTPPQSDLERLLGGNHYINAIGLIEAGDDGRFQQLLESASIPARTHIYIDSVGGNVDAAIGIGRIIRENWFSTEVGQYHLSSEVSDIPMRERNYIGGRCLSAATLVYLGGRLRYLRDGNEFGVHQFSFKNPTPGDTGRSQTLSAKIATYITDMGIPLEFLEVSAAVSSSEINLIPIDQLRGLQVITDGITDVEWSLQGGNGALYVRGKRDSLYGHHKVILAFIKPVGFLFWAVIEPQGHEEKLLTFGLVEIVLNGEETRIDISDRCNRDLINGYINIFAELGHAEAEAIAFSESFGVQVRFSEEAEMFLGVSAMSTNGGQEKLQSFFNVLKNDN